MENNPWRLGAKVVAVADVIFSAILVLSVTTLSLLTALFLTWAIEFVSSHIISPTVDQKDAAGSYIVIMVLIIMILILLMIFAVMILIAAIKLYKSMPTTLTAEDSLKMSGFWCVVNIIVMGLVSLQLLALAVFYFPFHGYYYICVGLAVRFVLHIVVWKFRHEVKIQDSLVQPQIVLLGHY